MRTSILIGLGILGCMSSAGIAVAEDGGIGTAPPQFLSGYVGPIYSKPYEAVCEAPPVKCPVSYGFPIKTGKTCWCWAGFGVFTNGTTRPFQRAELEAR